MTSRLSNHLFRSTRRTTVALTIVGLLATTSFLTHGVPTVHAADRPGTPTSVRAWAQDATAARPPSIRVQWANTATEDVCFEFNVTQNGAPANLGAGCVNHGLGSSDYVFEALQPETTYCFQVRARDWNGGDPQDGLVSDRWSAAACATTDALPTPAKPSQPSNSVGQANLLVPAGQPTDPAVSSTIGGSLSTAWTTPASMPIPRPH
jgi:hypothetical protein